MDEEERASDEGYLTEGKSLGLALPSPRPLKSSAQQQQSSSLEVLLATKNRRITEVLTRLRVRLTCQNRPDYVL